MTDLLKLYQEHRGRGHGHYAACDLIGRRYDLDPATVARVVTRAEHAERAGAGNRAPRPNITTGRN